MKISRLLLIVPLLTSLYGCSEEQPYELEKQAVSLWPERILHVNIKTDLTHCNYTLKSDNQEIATASPSDSKTGVYITAHKSGETMIRLMDTDSNKILCEIYVYVKFFSSPEIIDWGILQEDYAGIIVKAKDIEIQKKIENELWVENAPLIGAIYTFKSKTKKFTMKTDSGIFCEGIYEWDITSLTLMYDSKVERYGFKLTTGKEYEYIIQIDKTKKYQLKYPNAGITEVTVNRAWKDNGIIIE